jgi:flap endonuclease-1
MGIKGLTNLIRENSPNSIKHEGLYTLKDKKLAIDTSIFLYKSLTNVRYKGDYLRNGHGKPVSHIVGILNKTVKFLSLGITPIYIFDGKPPDEKRECLDERNRKSKECIQKMENATGKEKLDLEKASVRITKNHIEDLKHLFHLMGVSYIQVDGEAESYAAEMCRMGLVDAVVTEDMDTLVYGCPIVIRDCIDRTIKRPDVITTFNYQQILTDMGLTPDQFSDMCILCGCDYCPTIPKIGTKRAYQHIKQFGTIEKIIETHRFDVSEQFLKRYVRSRDLFKIFREKIDPKEYPIVESSLKSEELYSYLVSDCSMSTTKVQNALKRITR